MRVPPFPLDVQILARPVSANVTGARRVAWKSRVRKEFDDKYVLASMIPTSEPVVFSIGNHHGGALVIDADNAIKVAQDALNGAIYADDRQVTDSLGYKRPIGATLTSDPAIASLVSGGVPFVRIQVSLTAAPHLVLP